MSWPPNPTFGFFRRLVCSVSGFVGAWQIGCMAPVYQDPAPAPLRKSTPLFTSGWNLPPKATQLPVI